jgi:hypothetical protein
MFVLDEHVCIWVLYLELVGFMMDSIAAANTLKKFAVFRVVLCSVVVS